MRVLILAYNPQFININDLEELKIILLTNYGLHMYAIPHLQRDAEPIYTIQFMDTPEK